MKTANKFVIWALTLTVAASGFIASAAPAQATEFDATGLSFDFSNSENIGSGALEGFTYRYNNVVRIGGQSIDAIATLIRTENIDSDYNSDNGVDDAMEAMDGLSEDSDEDYKINTRMYAPYESFGAITMRIEFVLGGTSTPATLTNVEIYVVDIDERQFAEFSGPQSYEISTETELRVATHSDDSSIANGTYRFYDWDYTDASSDYEENWAAVKYDFLTSVDIRVGSLGGGGAWFGVAFQEAPFEDDTDVTTLEPTVYTINYDGNSKSSGNVPSDTVGSGNLTIAENSGDLARNGYNFVGWNTSDDGTGATIEPGSAYRPSRDITLYAMWEVAAVPMAAVKMTKIIYFNSASGKITPSALRQLRAFVNSVKTIDTVTNVSIYGYVQPTANNKADKALSSARAKNTASALKKLGIGRINDAVGMGKAINKSAAASRYVRIVVRGYNEVQPG